MTPLLSVVDLKMHFRIRGGSVYAVDGVSFDIARGETVGLVGESGCGKSTLGKTIVGLIKPTAGAVYLDGNPISGLSRRALRPLRPRLQMIFQDHYASLNPRLTVGRIIEEPLLVHGMRDRKERRARVASLMRRVGLHPEAAGRHPHEFSGGQRQRIGIARALALNPRLMICDEPLSALDVSVQAQVINLLRDLQREFGLAYLFISHDLSVVRHIADRVMVMYLGRIVEVAERRTLWSLPLHPYTRGLIAAVPVPDPETAGRRRRELLEGEIPSPSNPPSGCRFRTRCPFAAPVCAGRDPPLRPVAAGRWVACHFVEEAPGGGVRYPGDGGPMATSGGPHGRALG
ncbi:MAG: ATP-binding cassette domain-containing protein [Proteobacteria bacterium]|nr:ATP-binding cassette domain-containing protein [Pseudomonadota bacterium]